MRLCSTVEPQPPSSQVSKGGEQENLIIRYIYVFGSINKMGWPAQSLSLWMFFSFFFSFFSSLSWGLIVWEWQRKEFVHFWRPLGLLVGDGEGMKGSVRKSCEKCCFWCSCENLFLFRSLEWISKSCVPCMEWKNIISYREIFYPTLNRVSKLTFETGYIKDVDRRNND